MASLRAKRIMLDAKISFQEYLPFISLSTSYVVKFSVTNFWVMSCMYASFHNAVYSVWMVLNCCQYCYILLLESHVHWWEINVMILSSVCASQGIISSRRQAIIWTNAGILLIGPLGTNFNEILIKIHKFSFKKIHFKCCLENGGHLVLASMC